MLKEAEKLAVEGKNMYSALTRDTNGEDVLTNKYGMSKADDLITRRDWDAFVTETKAIIKFKKHGNQFFASKPITVDSRASHHMISDKSLMDEVKAVSGNVLIANGDKILLEGIENLKLFDRESTALYLPRFTSNLIHVKRATVDLKCQVLFRPDNVEFQDLKTGQVIGKGSIKMISTICKRLSFLNPLSQCA